MNKKKKISRRDFIKKSATGSLLLGFGSYNLLIQGCSKQKEYDLLISGGSVFDGLGNPGKELDIAVKGKNIFLYKQSFYFKIIAVNAKKQ